MKKNLAILLLVIASVVAASYATFHFLPKPDLSARGEPTICTNVPKFEEYMEPITTNTPVPWIDFSSNEMAREIEKEILESTVSGQINFAGRYNIVSHNCGQDCQRHAILETFTGDVVHFGLDTTLGILYRPNSRLIILNPSDASFPEQLPRNPTRYYEFTGRQLRYICEE